MPGGTNVRFPTGNSIDITCAFPPGRTLGVPVFPNLSTRESHVFHASIRLNPCTGDDLVFFAVRANSSTTPTESTRAPTTAVQTKMHRHRDVHKQQRRNG